jgi:outer membrane protein assembly factor BamB
MGKFWLKFLLCAAIWPDVSGEDWPQWGGSSPGRNMYSPEKNLPAEFTIPKIRNDLQTIDLSGSKNVKWIAKLGTQSYASVCIAGGKVYVGTNNDCPRDPREQGDRSILLCLSEKSGEFLWQLVVPKLAAGKVNDWENLGIISSPAIEGERVYIATTRCEILCLTTSGVRMANVGPFKNEGQYISGPGKPPAQTTASDADIVWRYDMIEELGVFPHNSTRSHILLLGDYLYITTGNGVDWTHINIPSPGSPGLIVLDKRTGKLVARDGGQLSPNVLHAQWSAPSAAKFGDRQWIFHGGGNGLLYAFDAEVEKRDDGAVLPIRWSVDCNPFEYRFKLNGEAATPIQYPAAEGPSEIIGTPVFWNNRVYVATGQDPEHGEGVGNLICTDAFADSRKGKILWNQTKIGRSLSTPAITPDGLLFIADLAGFLYCIDAWNGSVHWKHDLRAHVWGSPFVADGRVYIGNEDGDLRIFAAAKEKQILHEINLSAPIYASAVAANGVLYINSQTHLFAFENQSPAENAPAPQAVDIRN